MEPACGNTVLIIEDERDVVHFLTFNLRRAVQPRPSVEPKSDNNSIAITHRLMFFIIPNPLDSAPETIARKVHRL